MSLSSFGVRKPVVANLMMWAVIGLGLIYGVTLRREFFPDTRPNQVIVLAPYPGASPDEIERSLAIKIEDRIVDLEDIKEINTVVTDGAATIRIEFVPGVRIEDAVARVKREVDALDDLPEQSERIIVRDFLPNIPVVALTLFGDIDERLLKDAIRQMRDDLRSLDGMGDLLLSGVRTDEISVEIDPSWLVEHELGFVEVAQRVRAAMAELPGGTLRTSTGTIAIKTTTIDETAAEVRRIIVKSAPDGSPVRLGDIARVSDGFADVDLITRFQGLPCASLTVYAVGDADVVRMAEVVKAYAAGRERADLELTLLERLRYRLMSGAKSAEKPVRIRAYELGASRESLPGELAIHTDLARFITQRLDLLSRNALWGGVLVFLTLLLLLAPRVALWVTVGLVIAVLGTLAMMHFIGITLNLLTMFGLIVVLGLLVDDAIVVAENITSKYESGEPALNAAVSGTLEVEWPVVATVLTTIFAFMPLRLIEGQIGDQLGVLPLVVTCALLVSLFESLVILPSHMGHSLLASSKRKPGVGRRIGDALERGRNAVIRGVLIPAHQRLLGWCIRYRYITLSFATALLIASAGLVAGGRVEFNFLTSADAEFFIAELRMPVGTPIERTEEVVRRIEEVCASEPEVNSVFSIIGASEAVDGSSSIAQGNIAQIWVELVESEHRERRSSEIVQDVQDQIGVIPGVRSLRFEEIAGGPGGTDITLTIVGERRAVIERATSQVADLLRAQRGVFGIADDVDAGQRELRLTLRDGATELGFTTEQVAVQVRAAVYGLEAHTFAGDREDIDVRIMADRETRRSLAALERMHLISPNGRAVPLVEVVEVAEGQGNATIKRLDRRRAQTVTADVDDRVTNPEIVMAAIGPELARIAQENPGVRILPRGRQKEAMDSLSTLPLGMLVAVGLIYVTLAWLFSSYLQPLIVLSAVPFASIGAIWGHYLLGFDMTILSLIGFVALTGIVVNDSLIFMEFYNHRRHEGMAQREALLETGRARLRAILLTTMTTVLGLSPLMAEQSFQARFLIPMAITISFGLMAATLVVLVVLPCLLVVGNDLRTVARLAWRGPGSQAGGVDPSIGGAAVRSTEID